MSKAAKGEGTKIAQAAKDLNVTSVTIRRYISEFNIETTSDENGIKVLPEQAMEELHEIRRLKEDGLTNPMVLERLEEMRAKPATKKKAEPKKTAKRIVEKEEKEEDKVEKKPEPKKEARRVERKVASRKAPAAPVEDEDEDEAEDNDVAVAEAPEPVGETVPGSDVVDNEGEVAGDIVSDGKSKHTLTCQTCSKTFEHMNPRLRDCLECYRAKRKERRRGGDKHKNVIQHPLAQQVASKQAQRRDSMDENGDDEEDEDSAPMLRGGGRGDAARSAGPSRGGRIDASPGGRIERMDRGDRGGERMERMERGEGGAASPLPLSSKRINPLAGMQRQAPVRN